MEKKQTNNRYFLMRHGESLANRRGLIVSHPENALGGYGLTTKGAEQVLNAALHTRLNRETVIISSDYKRALETAQLMHSVLSCESAVQLEPRLRERDFGDWELRDDSHYDSIWQQDVIKSAESQDGVESVPDILKRAVSLIVDLEQQYQDRTLLLVSHGDLLQILLAHHNGINARFHRNLKGIDNAEIRSLVNATALMNAPAA